MVFLFPSAAVAQEGLTIPSGSKFSVEGGELHIPGDITIDGTFQIGTNLSPTGEKVILEGNWTNNGLFVRNQGTVEFNGYSGTQTVDTGGSGNTQRFYHLVHSGNGTMQIINNDVVVMGDFSNTSGTFDMNALDVYVFGDWTGSALATFTDTQSAGTVVLNGTNQEIKGTTNAFYNLTKQNDITSLTFDSAGEQFVRGHLILKGTLANDLFLDSDDGSTKFQLNLMEDGTQDIQYVNVSNGDATGISLVAVDSANGGGNDNLQPEPHWIFPGTVDYIWEGDIDDDWSKAGNWYLGRVPTSADTVTIPDVTGSGGSQPRLIGNVTITNIILQTDAQMEMDGHNLTITGNISLSTGSKLSVQGGVLDVNTISNEGTISLYGNESPIFAFPDLDSGTFEFTGDTDNITDIRTIPDNGAIDYYNLVIDSEYDEFRTNNNLYVANDLTLTSRGLDILTRTLQTQGDIIVNGGTLTADSGDIYASGDIIISSGNFIAPDGLNTFNLAGDFIQSGGTYTHSSGTLVLNGTSQEVSADGTEFYGLQKVTGGGRLTFDSGVTSGPTIANQLILRGTAGSGLNIDSDTNGVQAPIALLPGGQQNLQYLSVRDSDASGASAGVNGVTLVARSSTEKVLSSTTNWDFDGASFVWQGDVSSSWLNGLNWDLGVVPGTTDTAILPDVTTDPILTTPLEIENVTLQSGGKLYLNQNNIIINGTLVNDGTVYVVGNEQLNINTMDINSGTVVYTGDNDGNPDTFTIASTASQNSYYNLIINDTQGLDTFEVDRNLSVFNDLNVTKGTLDISKKAINLFVNEALIVDGGTLTATNANINVDGDVVISSGAFVAPTTGKSFTIAGSFDRSVAGGFTHSNGKVVFDSTNPSSIKGETIFYDIQSVVANKQINFEANKTQTILHEFDIRGTSDGDLILRSTSGGSRWNLYFPNGSQTTEFLDVEDSEVVDPIPNTNNITCFACTGIGQNNDDIEAVPHWIFINLAIINPADDRTIDQTPTIIGIADPGDVITLKDIGDNVIGTVTADANGNFIIEVDPADALAIGPNSITAYKGIIVGPSQTDLTVVDSPSISQQPNVTSHVDGQRINTLTPTIVGNGLANSSVVIKAYDANHNLLLQEVGSGTVDGLSNYTVPLTTELGRGVNYITVIVNGVASNLISLTLTDPFGVVFYSTDNSLIAGAKVSLYRASDNQLATIEDGDIQADDINPYTTGVDGSYSFACINGDYYIVVDAEGYFYPSENTNFPAGRSVVTGSKGEVFSINGELKEIDHPMDSDKGSMRVLKEANKKEAMVGGVVTYTVTVQSTLSEQMDQVYIYDKIPPGFKYLDKRVKLDGVPITEPSGSRPLVFDIGSIAAGATKILKYQLVVGSGVDMGQYENTAYANNYAGDRVSNMSKETVQIVMDPLFDLGTVIGKVFYDNNENGIQDKPEYVPMDRETVTEGPVPNVKIVMEDGTIITTDKEGRFSVPGLLPGRHLFRLDERSLPEGSFLTTDKVVIVDITEGLLSKVNFGVSVDYDRFNKEDKEFFTNNVIITQDKSKPKKKLHVALFNEKITVFEDNFVEPAEFHIFTNYAPVIGHWKLEIADEDTSKVIKTFEGNRFNMQDPIFWDGRDNKGDHISLDRNYVYRVYVEDIYNQYDQTKSFKIQFNELSDEEQRDDFVEAKETRREGYLDWLEKENAKTSFLLENIVPDGETIVVNQIDAKVKSIQVMKEGVLFADIPIIEKQGFTAKELLENHDNVEGGNQKEPVEFILPKGDYQVVVQEAAADIKQLLPKGQRQYDKIVQLKEAVGDPVNSYSKDLSVGEDYVFFVGMGDAKMGYAFNQGNMEPIENTDDYKEGFYFEGKLAYYIKGKILGKYLITSSYDSDRQRKEMFKNLDKDKYYPVYGDESTLDYRATDTQGGLYLMIEWDKSSAIWGNYEIGFDDTEFSKFSRTLYGGKVDFESMGTTKYGDPRTKAVVFRARAQQRSAHNEFLATGGSLYIFKHQDLIEGSDKVKIEVRDKITGLVISEKEMESGVDYELDYESGRMVFWKPVPMMIESYSIISSSLLEGNLVYVVTDYEYQVEDKYDEANVGARVKQAITDNVLVGATYVKEEQEASNYELKGADVTLRLGKNATVVAEVAQTTSEAQGSFVSTDGGLTFTELPTDQSAEGRAYGIKGDAKLFNRLGLSSYYKWIDNDFSTSSTSAQQGKELAGFSAIYDLTDNTRVSFRHDVQKLLATDNDQAAVQVGAYKTATTLIQMIHESRRLKLTGEYRRQEATDKDELYESETNTDSEILALRADYEVNEKLTLSLEQQAGIKNESENQTTLGATLKPNENVTVVAEQTLSKEGTATDLSVTADMSERLSVTGGYAIAKKNTGETESTASLGADVSLDEKLKFHTTLGVTEGMEAGRTTSLVFGGTSKIDDDTNFESEITMANASDDHSTTVSFGGSSKVNDKTTSEGKISATDSSLNGESVAYTFGTTTKINEELEVASTKTFGRSVEGDSTEDKYAITRTKDGKKLEGSLARKYTSNDDEISSSNIFGLSGDVNDKVAVEFSFERGKVQNVNGSQSNRNALAFALGYVDINEETGRSLKSSTKFEARYDDGNADRRQYYMYHSLEGKLSDALTIFNKLEYSKTRNITENSTEEKHREFMIGAAYRPVNYDRLNLIGRYTYLRNQAPSGQDDISGILEERAHVLSGEGIYDFTEKWQVAEKFAYRMAKEKVEGFDFVETHTWLMVNRLNYNIDYDWGLGGEFRILSQREAKDMKRGFLIEATRRLGDYAQLGFGYNFTSFNDDLTDLDYTSQGPFVRLTGKFYDRTADELARAKEKWEEEKIRKWAWIMVEEELDRKNSPIIEEMNEMLHLARKAYLFGNFDESRKIYKDIVVAGQMMFYEAVMYIRNKIAQEKNFIKMKEMADQYFKNGEYEKAKKILEKIMAEAYLSMVE